MCTPANGWLASPPLATLRLSSTAAKVSQPTMEISSMITKRVSRCRAIVRVRVECCRETMLSTSSLVERARDMDAFHEMPNNEKIVLPLTLFDAVPVGAEDFSQCDLPLRSNKHCSASM